MTTIDARCGLGPTDVPEQGLVPGQVGTIVEEFTPNFYEVEFCDDEGRTCAMASLCQDQLIHVSPAG